MIVGERRFVPHAAVRTGQIQVIRGARAQLVGDLAAVDLGDVPGWGDDRDHDRAVKMLVPGVAQEPEPLQATADLRPPMRFFSGSRYPNVRFGKAQLERFDCFLGADAATFQIIERLRSLPSSVSW